MGNELQYRQILEGAEELSVEEQEALVETLKSRLRERRRAEMAQDIHAAQREFDEGRSQPATPAEIMKEILS
jgi:hypothetical protein